MKDVILQFAMGWKISSVFEEPLKPIYIQRLYRTSSLAQIIKRSKNILKVHFWVTNRHMLYESQ